MRMGNESHNARSEVTTSGDNSPATGASHSGTGDINIDQSIHHAPSAPITYKGERLLGKSIEELLGYFETHTSIQAERIVKPFVGKPIRVEGHVVNIKAYRDAVRVHLSNDVTDAIYTAFELSWEDRLAEPNLGDDLAVMGRIHEISSNSLSLLECELIE